MSVFVYRLSRLQRLFLVGALIVSGTGLATWSLTRDASASNTVVEQALGLRPGVAFLGQSGLYQKTHIIGQACGYSFEVQRVYADRNRVILGYVISAPPGRKPVAGYLVSPSLTDAQGTELRPLEGAGSAVAGTQQGLYMAFDSSSLVVKGGALQLRLTVPVIKSFELSDAAIPANAACETYSADYMFAGQATHMVTAQGPVVLDLRTPVIGQRREISGAAATGSSTNGMIDRIVITPSDTRVYVRSAVNDHALARLTISGKDLTRVPGALAGCWVDDTGVQSCSYGYPLFDTTEPLIAETR